MREITSEVEIHAVAGRVWEILTDFARFGDWNPFIIRIEGRLQIGTRLKATIQPPDSKPMTLRPVVLKAEPERELRWLGHLMVPGIFDGEHAFIIEPLAEGKVRFTQSERFGGLLVPLVWKMVASKIQRGFELMNEAIKRAAEGGRPTSRDDIPCVEIGPADASK